MDKAHMDKLKSIARLNLASVEFKEDDRGNIIATYNGVSFVVDGYRSFDARIKEIKRTPPIKPVRFKNILVKLERGISAVAKKLNSRKDDVHERTS